MERIVPDGPTTPTSCNVCGSENFTDQKLTRDWACGRKWDLAESCWSQTCDNDPTRLDEPDDDQVTWPEAFASLGAFWLAIIAAFALYGVMRWEGTDPGKAAMWAVAFGFLCRYWRD